MKPRIAFLAAGVCLALAGPAAAAPGHISYDACLANDSSQGCGDLPFDPLIGARGVAASPDGKSVYVTAVDSVAHFVRQPGGQIAYAGCLGDNAAQGCEDLPFEPLDNARSVVVSPDGTSVYVAGGRSGAVVHFRRDGTTGKLAFDACLANDGSQGCGDLLFSPLSGADGVTVSPDGLSVYVASAGSGSIAHFFREPDPPSP